MHLLSLRRYSFPNLKSQRLSPIWQPSKNNNIVSIKALKLNMLNDNYKQESNKKNLCSIQEEHSINSVSLDAMIKRKNNIKNIPEIKGIDIKINNQESSILMNKKYFFLKRIEK